MYIDYRTRKAGRLGLKSFFRVSYPSVSKDLKRLPLALYQKRLRDFNSERESDIPLNIQAQQESLNGNWRFGRVKSEHAFVLNTRAASSHVAKRTSFIVT